MRKLTYFLLTCGLVWCFLVACERPAYAYVDPGSGLFLLQGISSAFLGVIYVVRRKLKLLKKSKATVEETDASAPIEAKAPASAPTEAKAA